MCFENSCGAFTYGSQAYLLDCWKPPSPCNNCASLLTQPFY